MKTNEENLRKVIIASPDGIVIVNREGMVQFVNPAAESLFGRKAEELVGELFGFPVMGGGSDRGRYCRPWRRAGNC